MAATDFVLELLEDLKEAAEMAEKNERKREHEKIIDGFICADHLHQLSPGRLSKLGCLDR